MKAVIYFVAVGWLAGCGAESLEGRPVAQAVRAVEVRQGPIHEGRRYLAEVTPAVTVQVLAQVPGTVSQVAVDEGASVVEGTLLARISAPDISARVSRVRAERGRAERERDFACDRLETDRVLAATGDVAAVQLDRSETSCAAAGLAAEAARAAEHEATVVGGRADERAPFAGEMLVQLVDEGQTVMPGTPLLQFGSRERRLRIRVPAADLADISVGSRVHTDLGSGHVVDVGAQARGAGRLVELLVEPDEALEQRPGTTTSAVVVVDSRELTSSVPEAAVGRGDGGPYVLVVEGDTLQRVDVQLGPHQDGWVAVDPRLSEGALVVSGALTTIDPSRPVLAVAP